MFIGKTVYKENKHSQEILDFIDQYNIKQINAPIEQVKTIADIYCNSYTDKNRTKQTAPMIRKYVAALNDYIPSNDAHIMAEATIGNCYLLTNNVKDFISFNFNYNDHRRVDGIKCINEQFKFSKLRNNKVFTPQPITLYSLIKFLRYYIPSKRITITKSTQNLDLEI